MWEDCCRFSCWQNKKLLYTLQLVYVAQSTSNAGCKTELRAYRSSLRLLEATRLQKVSSSLSDLAMISTKVENITNLLSTGDQITTMDVVHLMCMCVCVYLCMEEKKQYISFPPLYRSSKVLTLIQQTFAVPHYCMISPPRLDIRLRVWNTHVYVCMGLYVYTLVTVYCIAPGQTKTMFACMLTVCFTVKIQ